MNQSGGEYSPEEATIADLQGVLSSGQTNSRKLLEHYLSKISTIDQSGPTLSSIIQLNPDALVIADELDKERTAKGPRGPLHGIPVLLKDNIATVDRMETTAGSLALLGARAKRDAFVATRLRRAGAIILGKANLSEWANFRSTRSSSGWSARGGQTKNPYVLDRSPCGSSSGSGVAVAANLVSAAIGTETDGSILCPSSSNCLVGIKPTVGLVSRAGVIPISNSQDTVGPMCKTVSDAAIVLGAIAGVDPNDAATMNSEDKYQRDYTQFLDPNGLENARIGVAREVYFGYSAKSDAIAEYAIKIMKQRGATIIDPANIPSAKKMSESESELTAMLFEFKSSLNAYLSELEVSPLRTLTEIIAFNEDNAKLELQYFGQELFIKSEATTTLEDPKYLMALEQNRRLSRSEGIDAVMGQYQLDALVMPTTTPAWTVDLVNGDPSFGGSSQPSALAGYPAITVPAGFCFGLPVGITFTGRAFSEPVLIKLAYAFEQATHFRRPPEYLQDVFKTN